MQKTTQAMLGILLMITMSLSMGLEGMSVNDGNISHTSARGDANCTSDEGCPDGYTCSSDGVCVAEETCDVDGDCPDGETCEDGTCENTVPESSCGDTNQETNEDGTCGVCLDGYGLDENGECADDPTQDDSCTSDADCADGQICGAAGECMDALDDSGNETNDGGDEPQYRNCTSTTLESDDINGMRGGFMVCDEETGEWVELEDTRPTSVEIGCDEEPTEEQLDASNFADLLNEHDEILIRDGADTIRMRTMDGSQPLVSWGDARGGVFSTGGNASAKASRMLVIITLQHGASGGENDSGDGSALNWVVFLDRHIGASGGENDSGDGSALNWVVFLDRHIGASGNDSDRGPDSLGYTWAPFGLANDGNESGVGSPLNWVVFLDRHIGASDNDRNDLNGDGMLFSMDMRGIQIGMDENGNVTNANIVRSNTTSSGCLMVEDIDGENKDDGDEPEDESSNVLVAAGGVEVTTRDAAVAGVAAVTTALLSAVIRRGGGNVGGDASESAAELCLD